MPKNLAVLSEVNKASPTLSVTKAIWRSESLRCHHGRRSSFRSLCSFLRENPVVLFSTRAGGMCEFGILSPTNRMSRQPQPLYQAKNRQHLAKKHLWIQYRCLDRPECARLYETLSRDECASLESHVLLRVFSSSIASAVA